jgi:hypothetical protein
LAKAPKTMAIIAEGADIQRQSQFEGFAALRNSAENMR